MPNLFIKGDYTKDYIDSLRKEAKELYTYEDLSIVREQSKHRFSSVKNWFYLIWIYLPHFFWTAMGIFVLAFLIWDVTKL